MHALSLCVGLVAGPDTPPCSQSGGLGLVLACMTISGQWKQNMALPPKAEGWLVARPAPKAELLAPKAGCEACSMHDKGFRQAAADQRQAWRRVVQVVYCWGCEAQRLASGVQYTDVWLKRLTPNNPPPKEGVLATPNAGAGVCPKACRWTRWLTTLLKF